MEDLYKYIDTWDGNRLFTYIVIAIFILWIFSKVQLDTNMYIGMVVVLFVLSYLNNRSMVLSDTDKENTKIKKDMINPKLDDSNERTDIIDFLFSIQNLYAYNPLQYNEMVNNINKFFEYYQTSFIDNKTSYTNYQMMQQNKRNALNALMSMTYGLPEDRRVVEFCNNATIVLDNILTKYLDHIGYLMDNYTYKYGYTVDTKVVDYNMKAFNEYDDIFKPYSYDVY
jgi:uncharacterized membrane protein YeiB